MTPALLIAEREFRAYVATASFWIALVVGPLVTAGALALASMATDPTPVAVAVRTDDPRLAAQATAALGEAARIENRRFAAASGPQPTADLVLSRRPDGVIEARFSAGFPLSSEGRALVERTIERDSAEVRLAPAGAPRPFVVGVAERASPAADAGALARFGVVMILWLTLTGSMGMLLQAVARERANRALEGLLAAARPWEIVLGKVAGVGAVSALVLAAWLGSVALVSELAPGGSAVAGALLGLASLWALARAGLLYALAFSLYGLVTVGLGAAARDSASAQNLSRPMFAVLLAAFFAALAAVSGAAGKLAWLVYLPPFTPFMLLLEPPGALSPITQVVAIGLLLAAILAAGRFAIGKLTLSSTPGA